MRLWLSLAWHSAWSRRFALLLVMLSVSVSVLILLGVQQLREDARRSFSNALSGVDLIVGPRGSATELMLYSVFQIGRPSRNMGYLGFEDIQRLPQVRWAVPIQLGDSYLGHPVLGTNPTLFKEFKSQGKGLEWAQGRAFGNPIDQPQAMYEVVLGAEVAKRFGRRVGDTLVITHGAGGGPEDTDHDDQPLTVGGVLQPTGAPIDRTVLINLEAFEAMHQGWGMGISPKSLKSAAAALPQTFNVAAVLLVAMSGRRKELAILRAMGAAPRALLGFVLLESVLVCLVGIVCGYAVCQCLMWAAQDMLRTGFGVMVQPGLPSADSLLSLGALFAVSVLASLLPAWRAYRLSLMDGLHPPSV
ncbi:MAG: FtsX-like permease family protein [Betaproteobacteria bacterium]|nr:FtsX-like permease family protein [Betaproteobacteria bacterium]